MFKLPVVVLLCCLLRVAATSESLERCSIVALIQEHSGGRVKLLWWSRWNEAIAVSLNCSSMPWPRQRRGGRKAFGRACKVPRERVLLQQKECLIGIN